MKNLCLYIPEKDLYKTKNMCFELAHEVSHFVGSEKIRLRKQRLNVLFLESINTFAFVILRYLMHKKDFKNLFNLDDFCGDKGLTSVVNDLLFNEKGNLLEFYLKSNKNINCNDYEVYYMHHIKSIFMIMFLVFKIVVTFMRELLELFLVKKL